jgi:hypothetical protein
MRRKLVVNFDDSRRRAAPANTPHPRAARFLPQELALTLDCLVFAGGPELERSAIVLVYRDHEFELRHEFEDLQ